jgi:DNA-binding NarL/FixJ family response regulator
MQGTVRLIIVDDHAPGRAAVIGKLQGRTNFLVIDEAADVGEAIDLAIEHDPHVAVVALSLPFLKGIEITRRIKRASPRTEVLVLSSVEREDLISMALEAGARGFLLSTEADELLVRAIRALARRRPPD